MEIEVVDSQLFAKIFPKGASHVYNSADFTELNRNKCEEVAYMLFADRKPRLGMILGRRGDVWLSPFSAPFGGFVTAGMQKIEFYCDAAKSLKAWLAAKGETAQIALPPAFCNEQVWAKSVTALSLHGTLMCTDTNYHYPLAQVSSPGEFMWRNGRKNYNASLHGNFKVEILDRNSAKDIERAYNVIKANRESHGYPLRMSLDDVIATAAIVDAEFMALTLNGTDIAAAQIHRIAPGTGQVVYWGDAPGYTALKPMNFFTIEVMRHCKNVGMEILDIGPSSSDGIPSFGLCDFKESIGCRPSPKFRFRI